MASLEDLPEVLQDLRLGYMSLADLVLQGVPLTPHRLASIVNNTLGEDYVLSGQLQARLSTNKSLPLSSVEGDGFIALLLLGRLNLTQTSVCLAGNSVRGISYKIRVHSTSSRQTTSVSCHPGILP